MKVITISREFGSGGRKIGKLIADALGYDYYDSEIITAIANNTGMDESVVESVLESDEYQSIPLHYYATFTGGFSMPLPQTQMLLEQKNVIEAIGKKGKDCVIVGRNADAILKKYNPFNIFICADIEDKVNRCLEHRNENDPKTRKEMEKKILAVDKKRAQTRELITGSKWGSKYEYHVVFNTSKWEKEKLVKTIISMINNWYVEEETL